MKLHELGATELLHAYRQHELSPVEVAQAVLMVIGNGYMTGQTIQLNGGMSFI